MSAKTKNYTEKIEKIEKELNSLDKIQEDGFLKMRYIFGIHAFVLFVSYVAELGSDDPSSSFLGGFLLIGGISVILIYFIKPLIGLLMLRAYVGLVVGVMTFFMFLAADAVEKEGVDEGSVLFIAIRLILNILFIVFGHQVYKAGKRVGELKTKVKLMVELDD